MGAPLSQKMDWALANPIWAQALNPILANAILSGHPLLGVSLINGSTTLGHGLGRKMQGYFITDLNAAAQIYRSESFNATTLTLTSDAICTVNLWVY